MDNYIDKLNPNQRLAVKTTDGPLLVIAGAGSGKTTVLASRIAYILQEKNVRPWNVLAITFTNKAAKEMRERIERYIGNDVETMWIGTFHSVCVRILKTCIDRVGYSSDFTIYDSADTRTLMKECVKEIGADEKSFSPRSVLSEISKAKNDMVSVDEYESRINSRNPRERIVAELYRLFQSKLKANNALDFDDLIMLTVTILRENEDVRRKYQEQFEYILVDEYQDTNNSQYELVCLLANEKQNVCVVGDDDQSIYSFRGANINNILNFEENYSDTKRVTLDENYRSTSNILNAANAVIANNRKRMGKNLWTSKNDGEKISLYTGFSEKEEATFIAKAIRQNFDGRYDDFAILYRTNAQSRAIEEALMMEAIPYKVLAGNRFYDRKEIKDVIAYLKLIYNSSDSVSLERIINEPKRKIGTATLDKVHRVSLDEGKSMYDVLCNVGMYENLRSAAARISGFVSFINEMRSLSTEVTVEELVKTVVYKSGYMQMLLDENTVESKTRIENIEEFINVAHEFSVNPETSGRLSDFIENITLVSDIDEYDVNDDCAVMMTVHSAKGLEFPTVFITGMEEELFPSIKMAGDQDEIEEERRLCYVAITRAKKKLYMTRALSRFKYGYRVPCDESRFLKEIPNEYKEDVSNVVMKTRNRLENVGISIKPEFKELETHIRKTPVEAVPEYDFKPGERVRHRKFGDGTIVSCQVFGKDAIVVADFDTAGNKRLMAAFAKLERI